MSQVSLFRRWRSKAFSDLVGQEAVVKTLRNVLAGGSPARAYLFCGPRGTGKTSTARIFAKAICCENGPGLEPCNQCSTCREISQGNCLDVFEIDAASNTQVDKIRDFIVDKVHFAPAKARFKVYIIDEVHKLSSSSFNALLKTLEEPPGHVVFILATTHPHELLPTILSRCQRYDFRAFSLNEIENHLMAIAESESIELEREAAQLLARSAQGSMRDALVLLEQAQHFGSGSIRASEITQMLGLIPQETLGTWVDALRQGEAAKLLGSVETMHRAGLDFVRAVDLWVEHLRWLMLAKVEAGEAGLNELHQGYRENLQRQASTISRGQILAWLKAAIDLQQAIREGQPPRIALELCLVALCSPTASAGLEALAQQVSALQEQVRSLSSTGVQSPPQPPPAPAAVATSERQPEPPKPEPVKTARPGPVKVEPPQPAKFERPEPAKAERPEPVRVEALTPVKDERPEFVAPVAPVTRKPEPPAQERPAPSRPPAAAAPERRPDPPQQKPPAPPKPAATQDQGPPPTTVKEFWPRLLQTIRQRDVRLQAVLADCKVREFSHEKILLSLPGGYQWHFEVISKSVRLLEEVSGQLLQSKVRFEVVVDGGQTTAPQEQEHETLVKKAAGLFGGRILDAANTGHSE